MRSAVWLDTRLATLGAAAWGLAETYLYVIGQYLCQEFVMTHLYFFAVMLINAANATANLAEVICGVCDRGGLAETYLYVIGQYLCQEFVMTHLYFFVVMLINAANATANLAEVICGVCDRGAPTQSTSPARVQAVPLTTTTASALTSALRSARRACTPSATCQG